MYTTSIVQRRSTLACPLRNDSVEKPVTRDKGQVEGYLVPLRVFLKSRTGTSKVG